jgi:hypothetical protein
MKVFATLPLNSWHLRIGEGITSGLVESSTGLP